MTKSNRGTKKCLNESEASVLRGWVTRGDLRASLRKAPASSGLCGFCGRTNIPVWRLQVIDIPDWLDVCNICLLDCNKIKPFTAKEYRKYTLLSMIGRLPEIN